MTSDGLEEDEINVPIALRAFRDKNQTASESVEHEDTMSGSGDRDNGHGVRFSRV